MKSNAQNRLSLMAIILVVTLAVSIVTTVAQDSCDVLLDQALAEVGDACGAMDRNSACYGYTLVNATFAEQQADDYFTQPADRTTLRLLETITTASLSTEHDQWGIAVLNVQANIPNTLPGQAVTFVLLGDVEVENAVEPGEAFAPVDPIAVTTNQPSNMRSGPGLFYNVIGSVGAGTELQADGFSEDGAWLRVVYGSVPAWVYRELVDEDQPLDGLPTLSPDLRMPMQAFYLRTGIGESECEQAPDDVLMIQGPDNLLVDLTVNGADISIGSTILIRIIPPGDVMEITVIDGHAEIGGVTIYPGWKTTVCLSEPGNRGVDGNPNDRIVSCAPSEPVPLNPDEEEGWCLLGDFPELPINYRVPINCEEGIENPYIPPPPTPTPGPNDPIGSVAQCDALVIGGPTGVMEAVTNTFWWYPVEDATHYVLTVYDNAGNITDVYQIPAPTTWIDLGGFPYDTTFSWSVEAYYNDQLLCGARSSGSIELVKPPPPKNTLTASWSCNVPSGEITVSWGGAQPGDTLTLVINDDFGSSYPVPIPGVSGSVTFYSPTMYDIISGSITGSPSGNSVSLPGLGYCGGM